MKKILTTILLFSIVAFGQISKMQNYGIYNSSMPTDWKIFDQPSYSILYPATWELDKSGKMGTSFILFAALESGQDKFRENVNLLIQDLTGKNIDLDKYTEISEGQIKTMVTNSTLIESKRLRNNTTEYHKIIYTGDQGTFHLKFEQYYMVIDNKAYVLTFTCEQNKFVDYRENAEKILNSFKLKK